MRTSLRPARDRANRAYHRARAEEYRRWRESSARNAPAVGALLRHDNGGIIGRLTGPCDTVCGRLAVSGHGFSIHVLPGFSVRVREIPQNGIGGLGEDRVVSVFDFPPLGYGWWVHDTDGRGRWWHTHWDSL